MPSPLPSLLAPLRNLLALPAVFGPPDAVLGAAVFFEPSGSRRPFASARRSLAAL
jgi:hypothetical protein